MNQVRAANLTNILEILLFDLYSIFPPPFPYYSTITRTTHRHTRSAAPICETGSSDIPGTVLVCVQVTVCRGQVLRALGSYSSRF